MTVYFGPGEYGDLSIRPIAETIQWPAYYDDNQEIGDPVVNKAGEIETDPSKLHDYKLPDNVGGFHYIRNLNDTTLIGMDEAVINGCLSILLVHILKVLMILFVDVVQVIVHTNPGFLTSVLMG